MTPLKRHKAWNRARTHRGPRNFNGILWGGVSYLLVVEKKWILERSRGEKTGYFFCANTNHLNPWADKGWAI